MLRPTIMRPNISNQSMFELNLIPTPSDQMVQDILRLGSFNLVSNQILLDSN